MRVISSLLLSGMIAVASSVAATGADEHNVITQQDIKWGPAPASIPPGAQAAMLYGDAGKEGLFALRLKMPKAITSRRTPILSRKWSRYYQEQCVWGWG